MLQFIIGLFAGLIVSCIVQINRIAEYENEILRLRGTIESIKKEGEENVF